MKLTLRLEKLLDEAEGIRKGHRLRCFPGAETCEDLRVINDLAYRLRIAVEGLSAHQCPNVSSANLQVCFPCDARREIEEPEKK